MCRRRPRRALPHNSAAAPDATQGLRLRGGGSPRAMPPSWTGAQRSVLVPTAAPKLPVPTLGPGADSSLPSCREASPPPAPSSASSIQSSSTAGGCMEPNARPDSSPGAGIDRRSCVRDRPEEDSSRKLRGCWNLCHAPDPPGGDGRRKREAGGGGSSSRERRRSGRGRVALGEGSSGASAKGSVPSAGTRSSWGLIPQLQQLYPGSRSSLAAGGHRPRVCGGGKQHC